MSFVADIAGRAASPTPRLTDVPSRVAADASPTAQLVQQIHATRDPMTQGALLRDLDVLSGGRAQSEALLDRAAPTRLATPDSGGAAKGPRFDRSDLYGASGKPQLADIQQSAFGDCYYVATLGAVAKQSPGTIRQAIDYDPSTRTFSVRLHDSNGRPRTIEVTQAEIANNIAMGGGSRRDDGVANAPIWPDVMEVAYAKMLDTNHADGLGQGYTDLGDGGWPKDGMEAVTGREGSEIRYDKSWLIESKSHAMDEVGNAARDALRNGKPVTLWSVPESAVAAQDGLADNHVYTVTSVYKDKNGDWQVQLRNPWSSNMVGEGYDKPGAYITVPLERLVDTGGMNSMRVGQ
jgi:hypothetical protein